MIAFLLETLIATGALIALVLVLRRPVGRIFGPHYAYALWLLPLLRFLMPPILLPARFAPAVQETVAAAEKAVAPALKASVTVSSSAAGAESAPISHAAASIPLADIAVFVWLAGAVGLLVWRWRSYRQMREGLLAEARPVGEVGSIRLVETPAVSSPVAFGVRDKVVALPLFFMAMEDRQARDLAISHELSHHRGRDLLANFLAQPVLALHWFNPLAWLAWRALRRDQEAACDARVVASQGWAERARYAEVIASFAAGPKLALAAPMACPVLGEKSIIHRLRSLTMDEISHRRRMTARALLFAGGLTLPFTATLTYAANDPASVTSEARSETVIEQRTESNVGNASAQGRQLGVTVRASADPLPNELADEAFADVAWAEAPEPPALTLREVPPPPPAPELRGVPGVPPVPSVPALPRAGTHPDPAFEREMEAWNRKMEKWGNEMGQRQAQQAERRAQTAALSSLRRARETIARNRNIDAAVRADVLGDLDREIARLEGRS